MLILPGIDAPDVSLMVNASGPAFFDGGRPPGFAERTRQRRHPLTPAVAPGDRNRRRSAARRRQAVGDVAAERRRVDAGRRAAGDALADVRPAESADRMERLD